jgi:hypothetical protein
MSAACGSETAAAIRRGSQSIYRGGGGRSVAGSAGLLCITAATTMLCAATATVRG